MREPVLEVCNVTKRLSGSSVLTAVNLTLATGEVCGIVGPNGAGKTSLLRLIAGLAWPDSGYITILGRTPGRDGLVDANGKAMVAVVPESPAFIPEFTGANNLKMLAAITRRPDAREIRDALAQAGLDPEDRRRVSQYSLGMKQRLGLAQAIMECPRLMLLDEPTNGLDPLGIREFAGVVKRLSARGTSILMASHLLSVVDQTCTRIVVISKGKVIHEFGTHCRGSAVRIVVSTEDDWLRLESWAGKGSVIRDGTNSGGLIRTDEDIPVIVRELTREGIGIEAIYPETSSLEDRVYDMLTRDS